MLRTIAWRCYETQFPSKNDFKWKFCNYERYLRWLRGFYFRVGQLWYINITLLLGIIVHNYCLCTSYKLFNTRAFWCTRATIYLHKKEIWTSVGYIYKNMSTKKIFLNITYKQFCSVKNILYIFVGLYQKIQVCTLCVLSIQNYIVQNIWWYMYWLYKSIHGLHYHNNNNFATVVVGCRFEDSSLENQAMELQGKRVRKLRGENKIC